MKDYRIATFLAVCDTMNYRLAAERLHITQPAVTQHIHALEQYYRCRLFSYDGRRLRKTDSACTLERYARAAEYQEQRLLEALHPVPSVHLSIGATKTVGDFVIARQAAAFLADNHHNLDIIVDNTREILHFLDSGKLDFAIVEGVFDRTIYDSLLYRHEPFVGICSPHHTFAGQIVSLRQLFGEHLLIREEGSGTRQILEQLLQESSHSLREFSRVTSVSHFGLLCDLIAQEAGITFAYEAVAAGRRDLAVFQVQGWQTQREFNYVFLRDTSARERVSLFEQYRV